jgi:thiol-disulfide isomerase/thioredoxin
VAGLLALGLLIPAAAQAEDPSADREAALLHRRLDLSAVSQWNRATGSWQPLTLPPAEVYVVNLWSLQCKPCLAEFPLLRNILSGWKAKPAVQFLFIADPPGETSESEAVAFWRKSSAALPDADPCRATTEDLRRILEDGAQPITLLLDENLVVRQAFIGAIGGRPLGRSIERLLHSLHEGGSRTRHKATVAKRQ